MDKKDFRITAKNRLKTDTKIHAKCAHYKILKIVSNLIEIFKAKKILIFMPLFYEPNLYLLAKNFSKNRIKREFLVPFMLDVSFKMVKLRRPFEIASFGVKQPPNQNAQNGLDMAIIPCIGVDGNFARIGHGKGYYDIFFSHLKTKPIVVFVSLSDNFTKAEISQKHDLVGDFYITPKKNYLKKGKYDRVLNRLNSRCGRHFSRIFNS